MSQDSRPTPALFTQVDITAGPSSTSLATTTLADGEQTGLLRNILAAQDRQNELLEELVNQIALPSVSAIKSSASGSRPIPSWLAVAVWRPKRSARCRSNSSAT